MQLLPAAVCSLLVLGFVASPAAAHAAAGERPSRGERHDGAATPASGGLATARAEGISLDRAVDMVQRRYNAKVVRAEETRAGDDVVYRIRLLSGDGRVFTVQVNARTGQID
jgi:uncharacterized membrane protein YkoI